MRADEHPLVMHTARCVESESELTDFRFDDSDERAGEDVATDRTAAFANGDDDEAWQRRVLELLDDGSYYGWRGSQASQLRKALEPPTSQLLITDQRLMAVDINNLDEPEIEWSSERGGIEKVFKRSRFLEPGRIVIVFGDGSVLAVHVGMLSGKAASNCVAALDSRA
jgi:hypothetical protein